METPVPKTPPEDEQYQNISTLIIFLLLIIGLWAEYYSIISIIQVKNAKLSMSVLMTIKACIIMMLIHQFFIIRNFHIIDHIPSKKYTENKIGNWVLKSKAEKFFRGLLFLLFACLTGEIVYLLLVGAEQLDLFRYFFSMKDGRYFDIVGLTKFFIGSASVLALLMLIWDIIGMVYDKVSLRSIDFNCLSFERTPRIVYYPFKNPYHTFLITDIVGLYFWVLICLIVFLDVNTGDGFALLIGLLFLFYVIIIGLRFVGEVGINYPKWKEGLKLWWKNNPF